MPRIVIDCTAHCLNPHSGLKTYQARLPAALAELEGDEEYVLLHTLRPHRRRADPVRVDSPRCTTMVLPFSKHRMQRSWGFLTRRKFRASLGKVDLFHSTLLERRYVHGFPFVVTCHDLCSVTLGTKGTRPAPHLARAAREADLVLTDSGSTRDELREALGVPGDRVVVHPLAMSEFPRSELTRDELPDPLSRNPYCLQLASWYPRKNVSRTLEAFDRLLKATNYPGRLALAGGLGGAEGPIRERIRQLGLEDRVVLLGFVDDIHGLMKHADAFFYPSLCEGFGIPILESMASGTAVLTSNVTSMPEVGGAAAVYVDPYDVDSIAAGMVRLMDPSERERLISAGHEQVKKFSWERTARITLDVYRRLLA